MLKQLYIKNFTLIDELNISFDSGFSVITGETGAGKSIILGAINLLLGQRADTKVIKAEKDKCIIEAHFNLKNYDLGAFFQENDIDYDPEDCILRREINKNGKSRAFINDIPVQLTLIKTLGERLIDIVNTKICFYKKKTSNSMWLTSLRTMRKNEVNIKRVSKPIGKHSANSNSLKTILLKAKRMKTSCGFNSMS